jgi:catechol 2,3-dioxygenase-like lactoylglutathione lyase family enzyme
MEGRQVIERLSHTTVFVLDQDEALKFYRDRLGFEVHTDATLDGGFRWLTVHPKTQPDLEIVLMKIAAGPMWDAAAAAAVRQLVEKGTFSIGVFETADCHATYKELKAKGVEFRGPPEERFYGIEVIGKDNSGNWFSMTQRVKPG